VRPLIDSRRARTLGPHVTIDQPSGSGNEMMPRLAVVCGSDTTAMPSSTPHSTIALRMSSVDVEGPVAVGAQRVGSDHDRILSCAA